jgi:hypothetical protein
MLFKEDIVKKIHSDFGERSSEAIEALHNAIERTGYPETDRIVRCIIFLSEGNIEELNHYIEVADRDERDIMFWAEYERLSGESLNYKRVRDFSKAF